jgi:hypothetical protein
MRRVVPTLSLTNLPPLGNYLLIKDLHWWRRRELNPNRSFRDQGDIMRNYARLCGLMRFVSFSPNCIIPHCHEKKLSLLVPTFQNYPHQLKPHLVQ